MINLLRAIENLCINRTFDKSEARFFGVWLGTEFYITFSARKTFYESHVYCKNKFRIYYIETWSFPTLSHINILDREIKIESFLMTNFSPGIYENGRKK